MKILPLDPTIKEFDIYIIVSKTSKEFFVGKIKRNNCYQAYKDHAAKKYKQTRALFHAAEEKNQFPEMYILETLQTTVELAFRHCIAWTKYFIDLGYIPVAAKRICDYAHDLYDETQIIFNEIKDRPLHEVLQKDNVIVSNYKKKRTNTEKIPKNTVTIHLSKKDYEKIRTAAENMNMTMSRYCKNMSLNGHIVTLVPPSLDENTAELREAKIVLKQILYAYYRNGRYYPADLENIQKMIDRITKTEIQVSRAFRKYANEIIKVLPK